MKRVTKNKVKCGGLTYKSKVTKKKNGVTKTKVKIKTPKGKSVSKSKTRRRYA